MDMQHFQGEQNSICRDECLDPIWKEVWNLGMPPKVKHFVWRALHSILPTNVNLMRRGIRVDCEYRRCGVTAETQLHIFEDCTDVEVIWFTSYVGLISE